MRNRPMPSARRRRASFTSSSVLALADSSMPFGVAPILRAPLSVRLLPRQGLHRAPVGMEMTSPVSPLIRIDITAPDILHDAAYAGNRRDAERSRKDGGVRVTPPCSVTNPSTWSIRMLTIISW